MSEINLQSDLDNIIKASSSFLVEGIHLHPLIEQLEDEIAHLSRFNLYKIIPLLSGLLIEPQFHANTERIEVFIHLLCLVSRGNRKARRRDISRLLNEYAEKCSLHRMEDPNEDVFVTNIIAHGGNYLLLEGLWYGNDFYTQECIDILNSIQQSPKVIQLFREVLSLLTVSDLILQKNQLSRFMVGNGVPQQKFEIPTRKILKRIKNNAELPIKEIEEANIDYNNLRPFILNPDILDSRDHIVGNSYIDKKPLLEYRDKIIVALPSSIGLAIRNHILDWINKNDKMEEFTSNLKMKQLDAIYNKAIPGLSTDRIKYKFPNITKRSIPDFNQEIYKIDKDKYAHVILLHDDLIEYLNEGIQSFKKYSNNELDRLSKYIEKVTKSISNKADFKSGLVVLIVGGLGRGMTLPFPKLHNSWSFILYKISDFANLSSDPDLSLLDIWKLYRYLNTIKKENIELFNINGDFNLYAYWKNQGYDLLPVDFPYKQGGGGIHIANDFCQGLRHSLRNGYDSHAVYKENPISWIPIKRLHVSGFFKEIENLPIYVDYEVSQKTVFRGVVEKNNINIWVYTNANIVNSLQLTVVYRIWDAILLWTEKLVGVLSENKLIFKTSTIDVELNILGISKIIDLNINDLEQFNSSIQCDIYSETNKITINIPVGFLIKFLETKNIAERELIGYIIQGVYQLSNKNISTNQKDILLDQIFKNDFARMVHLFHADGIRELIYANNPIKVRLIKEIDSTYSKLGLSWLVLNPNEGQLIKEYSESIAYLNELVHAIWKQLKSILLKLNKKSVIKFSLTNYEGIQQDYIQWNKSTKALFSIYDKHSDVKNAIINRSELRNISALSSRILIEMATCTCQEKHGKEISNSDFDLLFAYCSLLLSSAYLSDAIHSNYASPEIEIYPNGHYRGDLKFYDQVQRPYLEDYYDSIITNSVDSDGETINEVYDDFKSDDLLRDKYVDACIDEYGLTPEQLFGISNTLSNYALKNEIVIIELTLDKFIKILKSECKLNDDSIKKFLGLIILEPRENWNEAPKGFNNKDWYPWRFKRRLSLLMRPIIMLDERNLIISPALFSDSISYIVNNAYWGDLSDKNFIRRKMKKWIGYINKKRGEDFEKSIAKKLNDFGYNTKIRTKMSQLGVAKKQDDLRKSDVDVLAWRNRDNNIYVIECKLLKLAKTVSEISDQLKRFRGQVYKGEKDDLLKHLERVDWLEKNPTELSNLTGILAKDLIVKNLVVTNTSVPMQYIETLSLNNTSFVPYKDLKSKFK